MDEKFIYYLLESKYIKSRGRTIENNPRANEDLFPNDWHFNTNYDAKIKILADAIENKCLIIETKYYNNTTHITSPNIRR